MKILNTHEIKTEKESNMIYEYKCTECHYITEYSNCQDTQTGEMVCDKCYSPLLRVYSVPNIQFKGSGFYVNDYKGK